jgi:hypothetical protein
MKLISTSALSKVLNIPSKQLFNELQEKGYIERNDDSWKLTDLGTKQGGQLKQSAKYGDYIVWPENFTINTSEKSDTTDNLKLITARRIGEHFELSANKINFILSELGWLKKSIKGWEATQQGIKQGGIQAEHRRSGVPFVNWPEGILTSKVLTETIANLKGLTEEETVTGSTNTSVDTSFREKFEAKHRAADGHFVRSKAEMLIDNWLYMAEIVHAYERKLPIEEDMYCDFYIPTGKVYIEYWGYENDPKYLDRKKKKIELYKKYGFNLIELQDSDVQNLDDILPRLLLKFGVQAY